MSLLFCCYLYNRYHWFKYQAKLRKSIQEAPEMKASYRKLNDHSHNSSTYHKKDGTNVRAILKRETEELKRAA